MSAKRVIMPRAHERETQGTRAPANHFKSNENGLPSGKNEQSEEFISSGMFPRMSPTEKKESPYALSLPVAPVAPLVPSKPSDGYAGRDFDSRQSQTKTGFFSHI